MKQIMGDSAKFIIVETVGDVLYFPVWWYSSGLKRAFKAFLERALYSERSLGLRIWVKNIFTPMFGQYDWQGRIISFFMRIAQIIYRSVLFLLVTVLNLLWFLVWIALPVAVAAMVIIHAASLSSAAGR